MTPSTSCRRDRSADPTKGGRSTRRGERPDVLALGRGPAPALLPVTSTGSATAAPFVSRAVLRVALQGDHRPSRLFVSSPTCPSLVALRLVVRASPFVAGWGRPIRPMGSDGSFAVSFLLRPDEAIAGNCARLILDAQCRVPTPPPCKPARPGLRRGPRGASTSRQEGL